VEPEICYGTAMASGAASKRATRDVEPSALPDLLEHPPRASLAFVDRDAVDVLPVRARCDGAYRFGVRPESASDLDGREVVLVIDDGPYWFELRGISVRGRARRIDPPQQEGARGLAWYAIEPRRVLAWDYGALREA
jgi:hypothetical protein